MTPFPFQIVQPLACYDAMCFVLFFYLVSLLSPEGLMSKVSPLLFDTSPYMSHVFGVFPLDLFFSYAAPLATSCTGKAIKSRIMNILVSLKSLNGQRPVMGWSKGERWHHNIRRLRPRLILKNLCLTKSETFSAELGGPFDWRHSNLCLTFLYFIIGYPGIP